MKNFPSFGKFAIVLTGFLFLFFLSNIALAADSGYMKDALDGLQSTGNAGFNNNPPVFNIFQLAGKIVGVYFLNAIGIVFMGFMIYAGILWMTARGNQQQVEKAQTLIIQAVVGLVIVVAAYAITKFVGQMLK